MIFSWEVMNLPWREIFEKNKCGYPLSGEIRRGASSVASREIEKEEEHENDRYVLLYL